MTDDEDEPTASTDRHDTEQRELARMRELMERSSLGAPDAVEVAATADPETVALARQRVRARRAAFRRRPLDVDELDEALPPDPTLVDVRLNDVTRVLQAMMVRFGEPPRDPLDFVEAIPPDAALVDVLTSPLSS